MLGLCAQCTLVWIPSGTLVIAWRGTANFRNVLTDIKFFSRKVTQLLILFLYRPSDPVAAHCNYYGLMHLCSSAQLSASAVFQQQRQSRHDCTRCAQSAAIRTHLHQGVARQLALLTPVLCPNTAPQASLPGQPGLAAAAACVESHS